MKKSDFKTFDIVTLRNNTKCFYLNECLISINKINTIFSLRFYKEDLTREFSNEECYDIMRVIRWNDSYHVSHLSDFIDKVLNDSEDLTKFKTIFEREKPLELTIDDIARKYNVSPNQIRIKK